MSPKIPLNTFVWNIWIYVRENRNRYSEKKKRLWHNPGKNQFLASVKLEVQVSSGFHKWQGPEFWSIGHGRTSDVHVFRNVRPWTLHLRLFGKCACLCSVHHVWRDISGLHMERTQAREHWQQELRELKHQRSLINFARIWILQNSCVRGKEGA